MRRFSVPKIISLESIDFQGESLFLKELALTLKEMKGMKQSAVDESNHGGRLSAIIRHHTNMNLTVSLGDQDPCVEIPMVNKNNVLINSFIRNWFNSDVGLKMIGNAEDGVVRGKVNMKTGKVSGVFSDIQTTIHMPVVMLVGTKYTEQEIAAIILHEVGHIFTYFEFMSRSMTTNQALAGMAKALDGSGDIKEREVIFMTVKKTLGLKDLDTAELLKSNSNKVAEMVVLTNVVKKSQSELGSNVYDFSSWEYLADQYAARQGAGRHLVTGLDKLYRGHFNISFRSLPTYLAFEALKAMLLVGSIALITTGAGMHLGGYGLQGTLILTAMDGSGDGTYDTPGARFKRVRNQIVENLKDKKLSKDDTERLHADLKAIDTVMESVEDRRQLFGVLWDFISPSARKAWNQKTLQKELEDVAVNELFVKASQLKMMAV